MSRNGCQNRKSSKTQHFTKFEKKIKWNRYHIKVSANKQPLVLSSWIIPKKLNFSGIESTILPNEKACHVWGTSPLHIKLKSMAEAEVEAEASDWKFNVTMIHYVWNLFLYEELNKIFDRMIPTFQ